MYKERPNKCGKCLVIFFWHVNQYIASKYQSHFCLTSTETETETGREGAGGCVQGPGYSNGDIYIPCRSFLSSFHANFFTLLLGWAGDVWSRAFQTCVICEGGSAGLVVIAKKESGGSAAQPVSVMLITYVLCQDPCAFFTDCTRRR